MKTEILIFIFLFMAGLTLALLAAVIMADGNLPVIVLGTEKEASGSIEYLCLGRGCERL